MLRRFCALAALLALAPFAALAGPIDYDRLEERFALLAEKPDMVGLAVAIVENGDVTFAKGFGETHVDGLPVDGNTVFRWASLSKGVAASVTGQLALEGRLSFEDTVAGYNTSLRLPESGERVATIGDVLSHQLGIVPNAYDLRLEDGNDPAEIRRSLGALRATCTIGDCHTYQNVAFDVMTEIIGRVTGQDYHAFVAERLFAPLGMTTASLDRDGLLSSGNWARAHQQRRGQARPQLAVVNDAYYNVPAAGGVNSSILDLAEYMRAQMGLRPDVLSPELLGVLHAPRIETLRERRSQSRRYGWRLKNAGYAYGWRTYDYVGEHRVVGHRGAVRGYRSMILFDPVRQTGVAVLWNSGSNKPVGIQYEVMDMVYDLPVTDWLELEPLTGSAAIGAR